MDVATHPNVGVCWNCNGTDLKGQGLEYNFDLVKNRLGDTAHVRELNVADYPYRTADAVARAKPLHRLDLVGVPHEPQPTPWQPWPSNGERSRNSSRPCASSDARTKGL